MAATEEYVVDKQLCIDCNACYTNYADIFKQVAWEGETKAEAFAPTEEGKYNPWDIVGVCPTDAITKIGEMPEKPEIEEGALPELEDLGPWEERWARVKNQQESKWEIMKRYGMAATVTEESDCYFIKVQFPEKAPLHIRTYQLGLPEAMPDYDYSVELSDDKRVVTVVGLMTDPHFKNLTGKINSFPDRFRRQFRLNEPVKIVREVFRSKVLQIQLAKEASEHVSA